jgi:hypothetical protein
MDARLNDPQTQAVVKALLDVDRLKMIGLLALERRRAADLEQALRLAPEKVRRGLELLLSSGLARQDGDGWRLEPKTVEAAARALLAGSRPRLDPAELEGDAYERKVLSDFLTADGRLRDLPMQEKKVRVILAHAARFFKPGERYPEKQVNELLRPFYEDTAMLRRFLVDYGWMERERSVYWLKA